MWQGVSFIVVILALATVATGQETIPEVKWEMLEMSNGIRVLIAPDNSVDEIALEFWLTAGSIDEQPGKYGFAHFFEHATPYGLRNDRAALGRFRSFLTDSNAQTRKDYTRYYLKFKPQGLELSLRYIRERLLAGPDSISDETVETHRRNVINEMRRQAANPMYAPETSNALDEVTFGNDNPYGHGVYGSLREVEHFSSDDIKDWMRAHFVPENIILFVVGRFNQARLKRSLNEVFSDIPERKPHRRVHRGAVNFQSDKKIIETAAAVHAISLGWPMRKEGAKTLASLQLLSNILKSRLTNKLSSVRSVVRVSTYVEIFEFADRFMVQIEFGELTDGVELEKKVIEALRLVAEYGVTEDEVSSSRDSATAETVKKLNRLGFIGSRTELLGEGLLFHGDPDRYLKVAKAQEKLKSSDIRNAAAKLLASSPGVLFAKGNGK